MHACHLLGRSQSADQQRLTPAGVILTHATMPDQLRVHTSWPSPAVCQPCTVHAPTPEDGCACSRGSCGLLSCEHGSGTAKRDDHCWQRYQRGTPCSGSCGQRAQPAHSPRAAAAPAMQSRCQGQVSVCLAVALCRLHGGMAKAPGRPDNTRAASGPGRNQCYVQLVAVNQRPTCRC
jgi:hypothetical protein